MCREVPRIRGPSRASVERTQESCGERGYARAHLSERKKDDGFVPVGAGPPGDSVNFMDSRMAERTRLRDEGYLGR